MAQYQTFPDAAGDSRTLEKLKALCMPDLAGLSFLDVGCNEGFFCGFAKFLGAESSVGVDHSAGFIERARQRFPGCTFHCQGWERLPAGPFDVVLLASALHYADDQPAFLHALMERLTPNGVLVLELGIVSSQRSEWVKVKRGIDERFFPTMPKLQEVLANYAWKWMGPSVSQDGDPVPRHVIHVSRQRPVAYLLLQPPGYGKTSLTARLFPKAGVKTISGDQLISRVASGNLAASENLSKAISDQYSPYRIDRTIKRVFAENLGAELVSLWLNEASGADFAVDAYVPTDQHQAVEELLRQAGYLPVLMRWERVGGALLSAGLLSEKAEQFYMSMAGAGEVGASLVLAPKGFVDEVNLEKGRLCIRGWAFDAAGRLPEELEVKLGGHKLAAAASEKELRPDVQRHFSLPHALVGYRMYFFVSEQTTLSNLATHFSVSAPGAGHFQLAKMVSESLRAASK